jgi:hypothetical protein
MEVGGQPLRGITKAVAEKKRRVPVTETLLDV